jgi:ubiquinone/menaquinone biosynthesis C-methylase UbiE
MIDAEGGPMFKKGGPTFWELVVQAMSPTERGYDLIAKKFDRTPFRPPDACLEAMAEEIGAVDAALDVCCGTGAALLHLKPLVRKRLVGLDMSQGMLDEARARVPGAEFMRGDALQMTYENEFDVVTCVGAFGHILEKDLPEFLRRIHRALVPGGHFVFVTAPRPKPTQLRFWRAHGFNAVMRVRNAVYKPEFIMYYLTFLWPEVWPKLERAGFKAESKTGLVGKPFEKAVIVIATKV